MLHAGILAYSQVENNSDNDEKAFRVIYLSGNAPS